jgi:hypothetical protein
MNNSYEHMQLNRDQLLNLGRLPAGQYAYHLSFLNPFKKHFQIEAKIPGEFQSTFVIADNSPKKNIHFVFDAQPDKETTISLRLKEGESIFIKPAICPQLHADEQKLPAQALLARGVINSFYIQDQDKREFVADSYRAVDIYARVFQDVQLHNDVNSNSGFLKSRETFYDFIDLEAARKQLDYVVLEKMLTEKKGGFFSRIIRKMVRKFFITAYKIFTRSEGRKNYIAKLYRNYINMNYLSERRNK